MHGAIASIRFHYHYNYNGRHSLSIEFPAVVGIGIGGGIGIGSDKCATKEEIRSPANIFPLNNLLPRGIILCVLRLLQPVELDVSTEEHTSRGFEEFSKG